MRTAYPRTVHVPWSPGVGSDDVRGGDLDGLRGREVVVTEKMDGENTTLYRDGLHARSLDSGHHPSRAWVKALQGRIGALIPDGTRVCGENLYARHSIAYEDLESWFYGFSVWDGEWCLGWDETVRVLRRLGIPVPVVLWRGAFDERVLRGLKLDPARQEGYVVRTVEGFVREDFGRRLAKWVRPRHVQTDTHWMHAAVVENGLGAGAALWDVRSGGPVDAAAVARAVGVAGNEGAVGEVVGRLDAGGRHGDDRLGGVLAALFHDVPRGRLAGALAGPLGMAQARRVADLVGLHGALHRPFPDDERRSGLARMALAADLRVLHAVAGALAADAGAREQVDWSALHAEDAGLLDGGPPAALRTGLRAALDGLGADAVARCWAQARDAWADGRLTTVEEAVAATWRWRAGNFPSLIHLVGPSGSGKSTFVGGLTGVGTRVSLDELRESRGSRADQRANGDVLRDGLDRLDRALAAGGTVVWDATSLNRQQRSLVGAVAHRRDAFVTHAVLLVDEAELVRRNGVRQHPVPPDVLTGQLHRFVPPYPGDAHRTWYVGASGAIEDTDGIESGGT
ncbi:RNA ligase family protein [Streptomyces sp. 4R-3d]|uniref:RNA ligase family protein n=1 Tax=Streptomyces sp. 4R-3d TaxID=2559605 RepID=UPI001072632E|nr:RNA ligase family protein [Streptomyces sp. 4R-3d]TFI24824.1 kinase [Streptomyces sp. 4R-3d]